VGHQVAAVVVAVAQDAGLGGQLLGDGVPLLADGLPRRRGQLEPAVPLDEVLGEELQFPGQLGDVERHPVRKVAILRQFVSAPLEQFDDRDRSAVHRRVFRGRDCAQVRLKGHVPEVLQAEQAEIPGVVEDHRHGQRDALEEFRHVDERQLLVIEGRGVERQHRGGAIVLDHSEVAPVGGVSGDRHDPGGVRLEARSPQVGCDRFRQEGVLGLESHR